jgi:Flp pilus assembly protein TadG
VSPRRRPGRGAPAGASAAGSVTLEWVLVLPLVALAVAGILEVGAVIRDALVVNDAARVGARAAATSTGDAEVRRAVATVLPDARVAVRPLDRRDGDVVRVRVELTRTVGGGVAHRLRATAVARTEPVVGLARPPTPLPGGGPPARDDRGPGP